VEDVETDADWGAQRIVNLMAAWRDQLLEVLGAMGMREVRRLRGELGRTIFQSKEEEAFQALFGEVVRGHSGARAPEPGDGELEGDLRWPTTLILGTAEQARTGRPPESVLQYRVGRSGGGFDRRKHRPPLPSAAAAIFYLPCRQKPGVMPLNHCGRARSRS
jgi:hypothetical protein